MEEALGQEQDGDDGCATGDEAHDALARGLVLLGDLGGPVGVHGDPRGDPEDAEQQGPPEVGCGSAALHPWHPAERGHSRPSRAIRQ